MNDIIAVDEIGRPGLWLTSCDDDVWLRHHVDQLAATAPDALATPARALLEEAALNYSHALKRGGELSADSCARVRAIGEAWAAAGMPLDRMITEFGELTTRLADLLIGRQGAAGPYVRNLVTTSNKLLREFLAGANRWRAHVRTEQTMRRVTRDLVADLIAGWQPPREAESRLAKAYLIAVVNRRENAPAAQLGRIVRECGGPGTLVGAGPEFVALIPDCDPRRTGRVVDELAQRLGGQAWVGVASRERAAVPDGHREASDILRLVVAGGREPGVYRLEDCLVEYAVSRNETVAKSLVSLVRPLMAHPVLSETLEALIRANFNRSEAAKQMFVHRSTLDYRVHRIEEITGHDPMSNRGAQVLCAAMTTYALTRSPVVRQREEGRVLLR
ncbi:MAG TPA: helix-turn-helix domain-containing protein [Amycolatopsis sp.]|uniref:PucR family transcriptional regulator n=1 Tax=Amycolatopsis sp. TaxID=37632 RepID=UPI002B4A8B82|nr:helix-turn-helix domain-containing protein [Amycolatopsis sp.]HKS47159.1 helix-turn-helix domain-containing protein [Amycolatopsis sp.]